jgi:hypothetical protein
MHRLSYCWLVLLLFLASRSSAAINYYVTDLGQFTPQAISPNGLVAGTLPWTPDSLETYQNVFLATYSNGHVTDLGSYGGASSNADLYVGNIAANGIIALSTGGSPLIYNNGSFTSIAGVGVVSLTPNSWGVNTSGLVTGTSSIGPVSEAFTYNGSTTTTLRRIELSPPNNLGQSIGTMFSSTGFSAIIDNNGVITPLTNSQGQPVTNQFGVINDNDEAIGGPPSSPFAFIQNGVVSSYAPFAGIQTGGFVALSNSGTAVGNYPDGTTTHALYFNGTTAQDLNNLIDPTSGWILTSATGISDNGYIIGEGLHNGVETGFVLTPVPEPASCGLILATVSALVISRRR